MGSFGAQVLQFGFCLGIQPRVMSGGLGSRRWRGVSKKLMDQGSIRLEFGGWFAWAVKALGFGHVSDEGLGLWSCLRVSRFRF